jgi:hypothetical protein
MTGPSSGPRGVIGGGHGGVDGPPPGPTRRGLRDAEGERLIPGVHGNVDVTIELDGAVAGAAVDGQGQRAALVSEVGPAGLDPMPDDVRRAPVGGRGAAGVRSFGGRTGGSRHSARPTSSRPIPAHCPGTSRRYCPAACGGTRPPPQEHRHPLREHQRGDQVARLSGRGTPAPLTDLMRGLGIAGSEAR